jgi:hypothetical protein
MWMVTEREVQNDSEVTTSGSQDSWEPLRERRNGGQEAAGICRADRRTCQSGLVQAVA